MKKPSIKKEVDLALETLLLDEKELDALLDTLADELDVSFEISDEKPKVHLFYLLAKDLWWQIENDLSVKNLKNLSEYINVQRQEDGMTALHLAVLKGDWDMISTLIEHGANIHIKNRDGLSPFELAKCGWKGSFNQSSSKAKSSENGNSDLNELWVSYKHYCNMEREKEVFKQAKKEEEVEEFSVSGLWKNYFLSSKLITTQKEYFEKYKHQNVLAKHIYKKVD